MSIRRPPATEEALASAAVVALGSNLPGVHGPPPRMLRRALVELGELSTRPVLASSLYRTVPLDCAPGTPEFVNAVALLWPPRELAPEALLAQTRRIEQDFGRRRGAAPNAPRTLDLDLICWGARTVHRKDLQIPHPRFPEREFVLAPLAELCPDWIPPGQTRSVASLLADLPGTGIVAMLE